jgi:hypothetical protein
MRVARTLILVVAVIAATVLLAAVPSQGATGDKVNTVIAVRTGDACVSKDADGNTPLPNYWTGIAFDGTDLILSCHTSQNLSYVKPSDGSFVKLLAVTGTTDIGALAYDGTRNVIWACNAEDVGQINPATGAYTKSFTTTNGCLDGLAYDGTDDTIWASGDAENSIQHYSITGSLITEHTFVGTDLGGCYTNSGIATGGDSLYLATNGCSTIWSSSKDFSSMSEFIGTDKTENRRVEDMECDNVTYAGTGQTVMWSQDAYDNILTAYEIPAGSCGFGGLPPTPEPTPEPTPAPAAAPAAVIIQPMFTG